MASLRHKLLLAALVLLSLFVALIWGYAALRGPSSRSVFQAIGLVLTSAFVFAHLLGLASGGYLWKSGVFSGRVALLIKAATVYFALATLFAVAGNALAASLLNSLYG